MLLGTASAAETGWEKEKVTDDGIAVFSRATAGTTVREVLARMSVDAPAKHVFDAFMDPDTFKETNDKYVEKSTLYRVDDPNVWYNYQLVNFPVIAKRDYCLRYERKSDPEKGVYVISWRASDRFGPPPQEDIVRVSNLKGTLKVTTDPSGKTSNVLYTLLADPGGNIPTWLINIANRRSLPDILRQVQQESVKRAKAGK